MTKPTDPILGPLNDEQRAAVLHGAGPLLILAGAGSGKTRALTHRIAHLMEQGVKPWQILAVTFTNKASREMKERIQRLLRIAAAEEVAPWIMGEGRLPVMGTFHSVCVRILRRDIEHLGRDRSFVIYDEDDQEKLMKEVLKKLRIDDAELRPRPALGYIGRFKSEALSPEEAAGEVTTERMQNVIQAYRAYEQALRRNNAMDFDDLILETVRLFHECPKVLERYQNTWRYLHVDEYQDTNHAQYAFITQLASKERNLCVIGDPDQSIYGFRGADIRNILEFQKEYDDAKHIKLERNYRSAQQVLTAADAVIAANPNRPEKRMWTERKDGPPVTVHELGDERMEAEHAIKLARDLKERDVPLADQVILYRTNAQSRLFEEACMRAGIPYRILGGTKFYGRREVKDVLAYLHLLLNPYDTVALLRVINVPSRKLGERTLERIQTYAQEHKVSLWDTLESAGEIDDLDTGTRSRVAAFTDIVRDLRARADRESVGALTERLLDAIKMEGWLRDDTEEGEERWQNVRELLSVMQKYEGLPPGQSLSSFLEEVALVSEVDKLTDGGKDAITLMTLHLCKGLEFEHVMIAGCEEGIFPHSSSVYDKSQLEEERRIMYVGMTRAKTHLNMLLTRSRMLWGERKQNAPSRFLDDLPDEVTERRSDDVLSAFGWVAVAGERSAHAGDRLQPYRQHDVRIDFSQEAGEEVSQLPVEEGSRIEHPVFGKGTILARRGDIVDIRFDSGKQKTFALSIAPLKVI